MKANSSSTTVLMTVAEVEKEIYIEYDYFPETPAVMYLPNGDPGYPAEPAELEVTAIYFEVDDQQEDVTKYFSSEQLEAIAEAILEEDPGCE